MVNTTVSGSESVTTERRGKSKSMTDKMVIERSEMLILFCRVAAKLVQEFCQIMVDYIASGHFLLY